MTESELVVISGIAGGMLTLLSTIISNKYLLKRERDKIESQFDLKKLDIENEKSANIRKEKLLAVREINNTVGNFERLLSLTNSIIESSAKMGRKEFDYQYLEQYKDLVNLQTMVGIYFPKLYSEVRDLIAIHNKYWGNQRILLGINVYENFDNYVAMQKNIIEISDKAFVKIRNIREESLEMFKDLV